MATNNAYSTLLNSAIPAIINSLLLGNTLQIASFSIGDAYGYTLNPNATQVGILNSVQFTGGTSYISTSTSGNSVSYVISLDNTLGNFTIGNVMLFLSYEGGTVPFIQTIFPSQVLKVAQSGSVVGNYIVIKLTADLGSSAVAATYTVEISDANVSILPNVNTELSLPNPSSSVFQQYIIDSVTTTDRPAIAMRRTLDNTWYGNGLIQRIADSRFGCIYGGIIGDGYQDFNGIDIWGGYFNTPSVDFTTTIDGGAAWAPSLGNVLDGGQF